jgi:hypothetical protein
LSLELAREVTVADALDTVSERLRQGLNGELAVQPSPPKTTPVPPLSTPGVDWHLHPVLSGSTPE